MDDFLELHSRPAVLRQRIEFLLRTRAQARAVEVRYGSLVESLPALVDVAEAYPPYSPVYISPNFVFLGYSVEEWYERPDLWVSVLHPEDCEQVLRETESARASRGENEYEYRVITRDGRVRWFHDRGRFVLDEELKPVHWQGIILDVTERRELKLPCVPARSATGTCLKMRTTSFTRGTCRVISPRLTRPSNA